MSNITLISGCMVFLVLGCGHWLAILFTDKFEPRDNHLLELLKTNSGKITEETTLWDGSKGFHMSHSLGMIIFGVFYITLALENGDYLLSSTTLTIGLIVVPLIYLVLAAKYWFHVPRNGFFIALALLTVSVLIR